MSVSTLLASVMFVVMQAQSALPPGAAVGPMSTTDARVLFRWNDVKGQINYGDRPPPNATNIIRIDLMTIGENTQSLLPYLVRRAATNFPVMLFTSKNCPPCVSAREFLNKRGIPFAERTIESSDDSIVRSAKGTPRLLRNSRALTHGGQFFDVKSITGKFVAARRTR